MGERGRGRGPGLSGRGQGRGPGLSGRGGAVAQGCLEGVGPWYRAVWASERLEAGWTSRWTR